VNSDGATDNEVLKSDDNSTSAADRSDKRASAVRCGALLPAGKANNLPVVRR